MQTVKFISQLCCIVLMTIGWGLKSPGVCMSAAILYIVFELVYFVYLAHKVYGYDYSNKQAQEVGNQFNHKGIISLLSANIIPFSFIVVALGGRYPWLNTSGFIVWIGIVAILVGYVFIVRKIVSPRRDLY